MRNALPPSSLSPDLLARRLAELVADERGALVEFLLHLEEFDRRRAWAEAGYDSLWTYCQRVLHLREGPAGRRIAAMRIVRQFPRLADALRDGRLCLSTVTLIAPLLSEERLDDVVARAAFRTKAEVEQLVASVFPRDAPREGIRRLPEQRGSGEAAQAVFAPPPTAVSGSSSNSPWAPPSADSETSSPHPPPAAPGVDTATPASDLVSCPTLLLVTAPPPGPASATPPPATRSAPTRATLTCVAADLYSLRVTIDATLKCDLDELAALLSHKIPNGDLAAVLREGVHCALEKHGRRKGARRLARAGTRSRASPFALVTGPASEPANPHDATFPANDMVVADSAPRRRPHIPAHVRREVWNRDGARCAWRGPDGHRCESRWRLELDHVASFALGGASTADGLRLLCRVHNLLHAEQVFGADYMKRFRRVDAATARAAPTSATSG